ncbi:MAG: PAS domain-containing protein, partial [Ferruginibacter sp.]|nr:PAS domain-containing protein [Ferruginibacter sp.]
DTDAFVTTSRKKISAKTKKEEKDIQIQLLEQELAQAREDMRSITEDQEASNEELQSANEELLSGSEELQSLNEELETSKEELQSTNEELSVLNHELFGLNEQVTDARNYSESIVATLYQPLLVLDKHLRVKTANKAFYQSFKVHEQETEGVLIYDLGNRQWNIPELRTLLEEILPQKRQITDFEVTHNFTSIGNRIILLSALEIIREKKEEKLILLSIEDVTEKRHAELLEKKFLSRYHTLLLQAPVAIVIFRGSNYIVELANDKALGIMVKDKSFIGKPLFEAMPELDNQIKAIFDKVMQTGIAFHAEEMGITMFKHGKNETGQFNLSYEAIREDDNTISGIIASANEVTEQVLARKKIEESEKQKAFLLKLSDAVRPLNNSVEIEETVTKIALDFMDADWCHYCTIDGDNLIILRDAVRGDLPSVIGEYHISDYPLFNTILNAGRPFIVDDVHTTDIFDEELKQLCMQLQNISFINVPIIKNGKPVGLLSIVQSKPRKWTDTEVQLTVETAERTWAAVERAKAEEALRQSEQKYRTLFTSIDQGFALCKLVRNKEGKGIDFFVLEVNPSYEKQAGVTMEMVLGKTILQVFPALDTWWIETYAAVVDSHSPAVFEHYFENTNRWLAINAYPGENDRFAVLFSDITERKLAEEKLKESENRFRTIADALPVLIWTLNASGSSSYYNKTFLDFLGVSKDAEISNWAPIVHPDDVQFTSDTINSAIAEHRSYTLEVRLLRADGQWRWVMAQGNPSIGVNNEFLGFVGSSVDITERKQAEEKIAESEKRYHNMIYTSPSLICIFKGEEMIIDIANDAILESWGKGKDIIGKSLISVMPEIVEQGIYKLLLDVYKTGEPVHAIERSIMIVRNGINELIYYNFIYQAQRNVKGEIEGVAVIANEVTPQALLNKKIKESEAFNSAVLESSPDCIKMMDEEGRLQFMNSNGMCLLEIDDFKLLENTYWCDMWEPHNQQIIKDAVASAKKGEKIHLQLFGPTAKGTPKWWDIIVLPLQADGTEKNQHRILSVSRDITNQKLNELKEMELLGRFQNLVKQAPVAICVLRGRDYVVEVINEDMRVMWDREIKDIINKPVFDVLPEFRDQGLKELLDNVYNTGERLVMQELPLTIRRHGEMENIFVKFVYEPLRDADGSISGVMALANEITEQVMARNKIAESEERFQAAVAAVEGIVWTNNAAGEMEGEQVGWNLLTGQSYQEYQGFGWVNAIHPDDAQPTVEAWNEAVRNSKNFIFEHRVKTKTGNWEHFSVKAIPLSTANGVLGWVGVHTNISERYNAEKAIKAS